MNPTPLYRQLASLIQARHNCLNCAPINSEWAHRHAERADALVREHLPSGGGFDSGTRLDWDASTAERLVFRTAFHHMDANGFYSGWTEHAVTVRPSLLFGFTLHISGRDRGGFKDFAHDCFNSALAALVAS